MRILLDSNVALDHMLEREPFFDNADRLFASMPENTELLMSASAVTDVFYIARKHFRNKRKAMDALKKLLDIVKVAAVDDADIRRAVALDWGDFEDAVQFVAGEGARADCIVTRDKANYATAAIPVISPSEFINALMR